MKDEEIELKARIAGITKPILAAVLAHHSYFIEARLGLFPEPAADEQHHTWVNQTLYVSSFSCPFCQDWKAKRFGLEEHLETHSYSDLLTETMRRLDGVEVKPDHPMVTKFRVGKTIVLKALKVFMDFRAELNAS